MASFSRKNAFLGSPVGLKSPKTPMKVVEPSSRNTPSTPSKKSKMASTPRSKMMARKIAYDMKSNPDPKTPSPMKKKVEPSSSKSASSSSNSSSSRTKAMKVMKQQTKRMLENARRKFAFETVMEKIHEEWRDLVSHNQSFRCKPPCT